MKPLIFAAALALVCAAAVTGDLQPLYAEDGTYLTWAATGLALFGSVCSRDRLAWIVEHGITIMLGLLGTVIGFWGALQGLAVDDNIVMQEGVSTALTTSIVGMAAHLYLVIQLRLSR